MVYETGFGRSDAWRFNGHTLKAHVDELVEEVPVALVYGGRAPIITMATPLDAEDLARGFAITEQIVDLPEQVRSIDAVPAGGGLVVQVELADGLAARVDARLRAGPAPSACGLCGLGDAEHVLKTPAPLPHATLFSSAAIFRAFDALPRLQRVGQRTGGAHAAAFADANGLLLAFAEDVGRHNALDKLVGRMARLNIDPASGFCAVTSRASFEMAQKAAVARLSMLCSISAPTGLAVRLAAACNLTLCAFVRDGRFACFSAPQRLLG